MSDVDDVHITRPVEFDLAPAAGRLRSVALAVRDEQLDRPTPCAAWDVRTLLAHVCGLTVGFRLTAQHQPSGAPPGDPVLDPEWRSTLPADIDRLVAAWREPTAWIGAAEAGGVTMPSPALAAVAVDELTLHAWDLAAATGAPFAPADADVAISTGFVESVRGQNVPGLFGPSGDVSGPPFERLLALAGRDPAWRP